MNDLVKPGAGVLFMKVGTHAQEPLEEIIERKAKEIRDAGYAFWGYGGGTCHPQTMVQPFAQSFEDRGQAIYLCMEEMHSRHFAEQVRATEYSSDGLTWTAIPKDINVLGSRYALVVNDLHKDDFELPLAHTRVAVGNSKGRAGDIYVSGRVDKACLEVAQTVTLADENRRVHIGLVARLVKPYAVYVRNR